MADLTLPSGVRTTELSIAPWGPGQSDVVAPYGPRLYAGGPAATGWQGTVGLAPQNPAGRPALDRAMLSLAGRLRGNRHRVRLPLPAAYRSDPPPANARASMTSARLVGENVVVTVAPANWGTWRPSDGSFVTVGDRLYNLVSSDDNDLTLTPGIVPLGYERPRGIYLTPGGAQPANAVLGRGMGVYRGSLYVAYQRTGSNTTDLYWVDVATGTVRRVLESADLLNAIGVYGGRLYAGLGFVAGTVRIARVHIDLADPSRNRITTVLTLTGAPTAVGHRLRGLAEWTGPGDSGPKMYLGIEGSRNIFKSKAPPPDVPTTGAWADWFETVTGPTGFTTVQGLSPGPVPGDPLYVLDQGTGTVWTFDGTQTDWSQGDRLAGVQAGGGSVSLYTCYAIEWYRGRLYVLMNDFAGTAGLARVNFDVPETAASVELANPFVMARLSGSPVGPTGGGQFPTATFDWVEVAS